MGRGSSKIGGGSGSSGAGGVSATITKQDIDNAQWQRGWINGSTASILSIPGVGEAEITYSVNNSPGLRQVYGSRFGGQHVYTLTVSKDVNGVLRPQVVQRYLNDDSMAKQDAKDILKKYLK